MPTFIIVRGLFRGVILQAVLGGLLLNGWWLWHTVLIRKPLLLPAPLVTAKRQIQHNSDRPLPNIWGDGDAHQRAWSALATLSRHGLTDFDPTGRYFRSKSSLSCYECAIMISRAVARIEQSETNREVGHQVPVVTSKDYRLLSRLIVAFEPELQEIGYFAKRSQSNQSFADIPTAQWAYQLGREPK